jgi:SAM-dependent methyltransferase
MDLIERHPWVRRHPWELARAAFVRDALRSAGILASASRLLDIGAGDAWLAAELRRRLPQRADFVCWDANYTEADRHALAAEHPAITFVAAKPAGTFDLLLLLDVLEHVPDDLAFLSSAVADLAAPGAHVLVTVPAWQSLFSQRDRYLGHHRRYSNARGRRLVRDSGLRVVADGGLFHALLPLRAAAVLFERLRGSREGAGVNPVAWDRGAGVTSALAGVLTAEARASLRMGRLGVRVPGLSYWALCRKEP